MLDVSLFRNPRFAAASASVTIAFFALFGFIFLITQFFQFFKNYSPLSTGVHLLPVATAVGVASVLGTKLAVRFGTKLVVAAGLAMMAAFYAWVSTASASLAYSTIAIQMVLFGIGMGFTSAPATEAIMGVVPTAKAGVGSAVNDTTRLLGGTLGVALIGSVYASLYGSRLTTLLPHTLPARLATTAHSSAGAALIVAEHLRQAGHTTLATSLSQATNAAFFQGFSAGNLLAAGVAGAGVLMALCLLPAQPLVVSSDKRSGEAIGSHARSAANRARHRGALLLPALPDRLPLLLERGRPLPGVLGDEHGPGDGGLLLPHLGARPVELLLQHLLGGDQRERAVLGKRAGELERDVDGGAGLGEAVDEAELVEALGGQRDRR